MSEQLLTIFTQFGAAGLIGLMWIMERRSGALRERQLSDAHRQIISRERELDSLLEVIKENTRAINAVEHTQRQLLQLVQRLVIQAAGARARPSEKRV
jgi:hypothetical protein